MPSGQCLYTLVGHSGHIVTVELNIDNTIAITSSKDMTAKIWDVKSGNCIYTVCANCHISDKFAIISPNTKYLLTLYEDHSAQLWDTKSGQRIHTFCTNGAEFLYSGAISPDNAFIVTGYNDEAKIWDMQSGEYISSLKARGFCYNVQLISISLDNSLIATATHCNAAKVWDKYTGQCIQTLEGHGSYLNSLAISSDNKFIVTGSSDGTARIWYIPDNKNLKELLSDIKQANLK